MNEYLSKKFRYFKDRLIKPALATQLHNLTIYEVTALKSYLPAFYLKISCSPVCDSFYQFQSSYS